MTIQAAAKMTADQRTEQREALRAATVPAGSIKYDAGAGDGSTYYLSEGARGPVAVGFRGKAIKSSFRHWFQGEQRRAAHVAEWIERLNADAQRREAAKAEKSAMPHTLKLGDILYTSWGYDQTNIEFFEVVAVRGACVDIRELSQDRHESSMGMQGTCKPKPGEYAPNGEFYKGKRPSARNIIRMNSFSAAWPWDGKPKGWSSYA
jgi:hypothetical protein